MSQLPRDRAFDSTLALFLREGYAFISNRCRQLDADAFRTRIMLRNAVCIQGAEAAEQFYTAGRFTRRGALPLFSLTLIQDLGSVMVLDGEAHRRRKAMFLEMMSPSSLASLMEGTARQWRAAATRWRGQREVSLFHEAHLPLCAAVCEWAGLRLDDEEVRRMARDCEAMVEGAGTPGPRNWRGHLLRGRTERHLRGHVRRIRRGEETVRKGSPVDLICGFRDGEGRLLRTRHAAVELLNVIRPTVANARYIVFAAMALEAHPEWKDRIRRGDDGLDAFVDEVRRFYPFIPLLGGRVLQPFSWRGHNFRRGEWVLFDLYGSNHDPRLWGDPETFRPERFLERAFGPYDLVSHGAGDRRLTHRCPGEWITVEQMKTVLRLLIREMRYRVPPQDLSLDLARIPALPKSGFLVMDVATGIEAA